MDIYFEFSGCVMSNIFTNQIYIQSNISASQVYMEQVIFTASTPDDGHRDSLWNIRH
jgi:hypothetical protein